MPKVEHKTLSDWNRERLAVEKDSEESEKRIPCGLACPQCENELYDAGPSPTPRGTCPIACVCGFSGEREL